MKQTVGFVGLGNMGSALASNLAQAGFAVVECFWRHERQALVGGYRS